MMDRKVLIRVFSPAVSTCYDFWIPLNLQIGTVAKMLAKAFCKLSRGMYEPGEQPTLFDKENDKFLDSNITVYDSGIQNATFLYLV